MNDDHNKTSFPFVAVWSVEYQSAKASVTSRATWCLSGSTPQKVYAPSVRARFGTTTHFCKVVGCVCVCVCVCVVCVCEREFVCVYECMYVYVYVYV